MRAPAILGFLVALLVGIVALAAVIAALGNQPPITATLDPYATPAAMASPTPSLTPSPMPPLASPTPTPIAGETSVPLGTAIGQRAPGFTLPHFAGGEIGTADSAGKPLWVNFMATWCPACEDELPMMMRFRLDLGESMDMIVVDVGENAETVSDFLTRLGVDLPVALDQDGVVQQQWSADVLPIHFWLDGNGVVQEIVYGGAPREIFEQAILKVVPEATFSAP